MPGAEQEHRYPCEQCGADLRFAPGQTELVCDFCGHTQPIPAAIGQGEAKGLRELPLESGLALKLPADAVTELRTLTCPNCAAVFELTGANHATECPFCATPVVIDTGTTRQIKPQGLIPFALTEDAGRAALSRWLSGRWFAPNGLTEYARKGRKMNGVYAPFWTFDADTASRYQGQRGTHYYETRTVTVNVNGRQEQREERVQRTSWAPVSGQVSRQFDDVLVLASTSLPRNHADGLKPWDLSALVPYRPDYLAGLNAEGYTVDLDEGAKIAKGEMARVIEADARRDIGGDEQRVQSVSTNYSAETFKHILLPIWMAAYKYRGKSYRFAVNGQTGKVQGERPWSVMKITLAVIAAAIVIGVVVLISQNQ